MSSEQVIVVGAGLSGLSAAKWLKEAGIGVTVLECRDRVGGRTFTKKDPKVEYVDLGGAYVGPTQNRVLRLIKENNIKLYKVNEEQDLVHFKNGKRRYFKPNTLPTYWNPFINMDINNFFRLLDTMGQEIPPEAPWNAPHAKEWDRMTVKQFADKNCWTREGRNFASFFVNINVTSEDYEVSLLWFLWYIRQCGGIKRIFSTTNGGQENKFVGGSQQLSERITEKLGDIVHLNKAVVSIEQSPSGVTVKTLDGSSYKGSFVILALAPIIQMKIHFQPPLSALRNQLIQRQPMGSVIKCIVYYNKPFWRRYNCCGSMIIEGDDSHPILFTLDDTKPDGSCPAIIGFIAADKCRRLVSATKEQRKQLITESFAKALGTSEALNAIHYEEHAWMGEQYSGGCYTAMCPPGFLTIFGSILRKPEGRLYFAGTETATEWSGYMEGAIQAGERSAREILHAVGRIGKRDIWQTEPESKDIFPRPFHDSLYEKYMPSVPGFLKLTFSMAVVSTGLMIYRNCVKTCSRAIWREAMRK